MGLASGASSIGSPAADQRLGVGAFVLLILFALYKLTRLTPPQFKGRHRRGDAGEAGLLSGELVKLGRQFAWHVDHDAMTAGHLHDLPSCGAFIFLCEETKGTWIPVIRKDVNSPLDCVGSA